MATLHPHLMFQDGRAGEALAFYVSLFADGEVLSSVPGPEGTVMVATARFAGQTVAVADSPVKHAFEFTPSVSLFVTCDDEAQLDKLFAALSEGGGTLMPLGNYGFSQKFGWLNDRYGVSWQLNLP